MEILSLCYVDVVEYVVDEFFLADAFDYETLCTPLIDLINEESTNNKSISSQVQGMELKTLPTHLKYVYLGGINTLLAIIFRELTLDQEKTKRRC